MAIKYSRLWGIRAIRTIRDCAVSAQSSIGAGLMPLALLEQLADKISANGCVATVDRFWLAHHHVLIALCQS